MFLKGTYTPVPIETPLVKGLGLEGVLVKGFQLDRLTGDSLNRTAEERGELKDVNERRVNFLIT